MDNELCSSIVPRLSQSSVFASTYVQSLLIVCAFFFESETLPLPPLSCLHEINIGGGLAYYVDAVDVKL